MLLDPGDTVFPTGLMLFLIRSSTPVPLWQKGNVANALKNQDKKKKRKNTQINNNFKFEQLDVGFHDLASLAHIFRNTIKEMFRLCVRKILEELQILEGTRSLLCSWEHS